MFEILRFCAVVRSPCMFNLLSITDWFQPFFLNIWNRFWIHAAELSFIRFVCTVHILYTYCCRNASMYIYLWTEMKLIVYLIYFVLLCMGTHKQCLHIVSTVYPIIAEIYIWKKKRLSVKQWWQKVRLRGKTEVCISITQ